MTRHRSSIAMVLLAGLTSACGEASDPTPPGEGIEIVPIHPVAAEFVDVMVPVSVRVVTEATLAGVTARVGPVLQPLTFDPVESAWSAVINLEPIDSPSDQTIVYSAIDVSGGEQAESVTVRFDRLPIVTIHSPLDDALATPTIRVIASCTDDAPGGCSGLRVDAWSGHGFGYEETTGGPVDAIFDLSQFEATDWYDGAGMGIYANGFDALRPDTPRISTVFRTLYVDATPNLTRVASTGTGRLIDATATHLLVVDGGVLDSIGTDTLRMVDRQAGTSITLHDLPGQAAREGALFPGGAIFLVRDASQQSVLKEWRNGVVTVLATDVSAFEVEGAFAIWWSQGALRRRDLAGGTTVKVATDAAPDGSDVAADGAVAYWTPATAEIHLFRNGISEQLTTDGGSAIQNSYPMTDGRNVVYQRSPNPLAGEGSVLRLVEPAGVVTLAPDPWCQMDLLPERDYRANGGWTAYIQYNLNQSGIGGCWVWRRSPTGEMAQVDEFGYNNRLELISNSGEIVFTTTDGGHPHSNRFRAPVGGSPIKVSTTLGRPVYIDGQLHVMIGSTLLRPD